MTSALPALDVPVLDVSSVLTGEAPDELAAAVRDACTSIGFLQIVGHGVPMDVLDAVYASMAALTRLPEANKASLLSPDGHPFRGWFGSRDEAGTLMRERIEVQHYDSAEQAIADGIDPKYADYFPRNVWPTEVSGFESTWRTCFDQMRHLGDRMMSLFASALALPADYFEPFLQRDVSCFAVNAYPAQARSAKTAGLRTLFKEHTDSGTLTLLHQRGGYAGLQIRLFDDSWHTVPVRPEAFVINLGDLMARWTNGQWLSTRHRVVAAADDASSRMSITTFHLPAVDTVIAPLSSCVGPEGPRFEAVTPYEWESAYLDKLYPERRLGKYV
jgi:isopenicillin N synthase-like dioxygenase